jgi:hypothetical protein
MNRLCRILNLHCLYLLLGLLAASTCPAGQPVMTSPPKASLKSQELRMWITVNEKRFAITLADNSTARAFAAQLPLTLNMEELNGNEKHARLPVPLPANASRPGVISSGDLMLYGTDTIVVFYSTFHSQYAYTRIGRVEQTTGLAQTLGPGNAQVTFSTQR